MLSTAQMKEQAPNYSLCFCEDVKVVYLIKSKGDVKISIERAIEWVNAGVDDLDCRSKEQMLTLLNSWL